MATPSAPTNRIENKENRTFTFTLNPSYLLLEHEYSTDFGVTYNECLSSVISLPIENFYNVGHVMVRVKAIGGDTASDTLDSRLAYFRPTLVKPSNATDIAVVSNQGQSNASGNTNGQGIPVVPYGMEWFDSVLRTALYSTTVKESWFPALCNRYYELTGTTVVAINTATGGKSLQYIPETGDDNWSADNGTLRYESLRAICECLDSLSQNLLYNVVDQYVLYSQGEEDANQDSAGNTATSAGFITELKSLAQQNYDSAGLTSLDVVTLGVYSSESGFANTYLEKYRNAQYQSAIESDLINNVYDYAKLDDERGWLHDGVHREQQAQNDAGTRSVEIRLNEPHKQIIDVLTTELIDTDDMLAYLQFNGDGTENAVIGADSNVMYETATTQVDAEFPYGKVLYLDGDGAYSELPVGQFDNDAFTVGAFLKLPSSFQSGQDYLWSDWIGSWGGAGADKGHGVRQMTIGTGCRIVFAATSEQVWDASYIDPLFDGEWHSFFYTVKHLYGTPTVELFIDGISAGEKVYVDNPSITEWTPSLETFKLGCTQPNKTGNGGPRNEMYIKNFQIYNRMLTDAEMVTQSDFTAYNTINTPATPDAPIITNEDNDTNLFEFTATGDTEMSIQGGTYFDQGSPYNVGNINLAIGDIEIRVKEEGVNPASDITASTIAYTEDDEINYVDIVLYSKDLDGVAESTVKVKLLNDSVQYKESTVLRSETLTYTPDVSNGKVTMSLPDTDNMEDSGSQFYIVEFTDSAYKIQVPNVSPVNFRDLNPILTKIRI